MNLGSVSPAPTTTTVYSDLDGDFRVRVNLFELFDPYSHTYLGQE